MSYDNIARAFRNGNGSLFALAVDRGAIPGLSSVFVFGRGLQIGAVEQTLWDEGGIYQYQSAASTLTISSDDIEDIYDTGDGLHDVTIFGLDKNYNELPPEIVQLNGLNGVVTVNSYLRVNEIRGISGGSLNTNKGNIYLGFGTITSGKPATVCAKITAGRGRSLMAVYTVPANHTFHGRFSNYNAGQNDRAQTRLIGKFLDSIDLTVDEARLYQNFVEIDRKDFLITAPGKTDIELRGAADLGNVDITGSFGGWLVNETLIKNGDD